MPCSSVNETNKCAQPKILCIQTWRLLCFSCLNRFADISKFVMSLWQIGCIVVDCNVPSFHGDIMYNVLLSTIIYDIIPTNVKTRSSEYLRNKLFLFCHVYSKTDFTLINSRVIESGNFLIIWCQYIENRKSNNKMLHYLHVNTSDVSYYTFEFF